MIPISIKINYYNFHVYVDSVLFKKRINYPSKRNTHKLFKLQFMCISFAVMHTSPIVPSMINKYSNILQIDELL